MKEKIIYSNKNLENKILISNKTLGDTMQINEEHLYFLDRDEHHGISDDEACNTVETLLSFKSIGEDQELTIGEMIKRITAEGTVPVLKEKYSHVPLDTPFTDLIVDFVDDIDLEWDWDLFENVVLLDGHSFSSHLDHARDCDENEGPSWKRHLDSVGFPY